MKKKACLVLLYLLIFVSVAFAQHSTVIITAADNCTEELYIPSSDNLNIKIIPNSNTDLTIALENKFPDESIWAHVDEWVLTGSSKDQVYRTATPEQEAVWYRLRCSSYTSGNCTVRIGH